MHQCSTVGELQEAISHHCNAHDKLRLFYYSNSQHKQRRRMELEKRRFYDKLAAVKRKSSDAKRSIVIIGGR
jgi:exonuclease III